MSCLGEGHLALDATLKLTEQSLNVHQYEHVRYLLGAADMKVPTCYWMCWGVSVSADWLWSCLPLGPHPPA